MDTGKQYPSSEKWKVADLLPKFRGWEMKDERGKKHQTAPTKEEIEKAVEEAKLGKLETLIFDSDDFKAEFAKYKSQGFAVAFTWFKNYNASRVAYLVEKGWAGHPIKVMMNGDLNDGQHRIMAACFLGLKEVDVLVIEK
jgi:hypothetical protein